MKNIHRTLHLQHHRHTGRVLHHRHTSYRGLALLLVLAGISMVGISLMARATADSLYVYATVPAVEPTIAAVITTPHDGASLHESAITVTGTCQATSQHVVVELVDNGMMIGSVVCGNDDTFSLPIQLAEGSHTLIARSVSITGSYGPDSDPVHITYTVPAPAPNGPVSSPASAQPHRPHSPGPLELLMTQGFIVYGPSRDASWVGQVKGGIPPYTVHIDWGDGTITSGTWRDINPHALSHHYRRIHPYDVTIRVSDSSGTVIVQHYAAVSPFVSPFGAGNTDSDGTSGGFWADLGTLFGGTELFGAYIAYAMLLLAFGMLWRQRHPFAYAKVPVRRRSTNHHILLVAGKRRTRKRTAR